jgi:dynein heavy chain
MVCLFFHLCMCMYVCVCVCLCVLMLQLPAFKNLISSFEQSSRDWKRWFSSAEPPPEKALPGDWGTKLNELQVLLILRCLRPDRILFAARSFISANLGPAFVDPPELKLNEIFHASNNVTPIIFVLSPGVDPTANLNKLAYEEGQEIEAVSLGQGQTPIALRALDRGLTLGKWVFFANCHLSISWMPALEQLIAGYCNAAKKPHDKFRLWLSSSPDPNFPISILQRSIKVTTEPPKGLRNNMIRLYGNVSLEQFNKCNRPERYKKLLFSLSWFHALMLERRKFQTLGWNVKYDFNDSDFSICENLLTMYLSTDPEAKKDAEDVIPWEAMKYLIAEANYGTRRLHCVFFLFLSSLSLSLSLSLSWENFSVLCFELDFVLCPDLLRRSRPGGRVTDDRDRRVLRVYINQFFCDAAIQTPNYPLSSLPTYFIPDDGQLQSYRDYVKTLPMNGDHPEAFGQHGNAEISALMVDSTNLLSTLIALQPREVVAGSKSPEDTVYDLCDNLASSIPLPLNLAAIYKKHEMDNSPLKVVLVQEIARFNRLLGRIHQSLKDLQKGLRGLVVISSELEAVFNALFVAKVPDLWSTAYPSIKPLGPWVRDLILRVEQLRKWADEAIPKVFWLAGFTFPSGFLTALQQSTSRRSGIPIDVLGWEFIIMTSDEAAITVYPKEGAYIRGLYLEGARWDTEYGCLADSNPMELTCSMPIIHFKPIELKRRSLKGIYQCPLYVWPVRGGTMSFVSFLMYVEVKSGAKDAEHWIKRGTAMLLALAQ